MATATTTSVASTFSTPFHTIKCAKPIHLWAPSDQLRFFSSRTIPLHPLSVPKSKTNHGIEPLSINSSRRRVRIAAAVAQEEVVEVQGEVHEETVGVQAEKEEKVENEVKVNTKIYFGNLPYNCDSATLAGLVQQFAEPELVEVLYDKETGKGKGYAFVTMSSIEDCEKVIQNLDRSELGGRYLRANFSDKPKPKEPLFTETDFKLFVGNLSWSVTSESLQRVFQETGNIVSSRVIYDGETGRSKGFGFISYQTKSEMEKALEVLDGLELEGRPIRVRVAEGKKSQY